MGVSHDRCKKGIAPREPLFFKQRFWDITTALSSNNLNFHPLPTESDPTAFGILMYQGL